MYEFLTRYVIKGKPSLKRAILHIFLTSILKRYYLYTKFPQNKTNYLERFAVKLTQQ